MVVNFFKMKQLNEETVGLKISSSFPTISVHLLYFPVRPMRPQIGIIIIMIFFTISCYSCENIQTNGTKKFLRLYNTESGRALSPVRLYTVSGGHP